MLPTFEFARPATLSEALEILDAQPGACPVAGGTNLLVDARAGRLRPRMVVDIHALSELRGIEVVEGDIVIGTAVTVDELLQDPFIRERAAVLHSACLTFANPLIRRRATIGGNLVNNAPCADTAPALLVLDARVSLASVAGTRDLSLEEFLVEPFRTRRHENEILTAVRFPIPSPTSVARFRKLGLRKISCMAKVDVAVFADFDTHAICREARIALAAASPVALRVRDAETALVGAAMTDERIRYATTLAQQAALPRSGSEYKQQVVSGLVRRLLTEISMEVERRHA